MFVIVLTPCAGILFLIFIFCSVLLFVEFCVYFTFIIICTALKFIYVALRARRAARDVYAMWAERHFNSLRRHSKRLTYCEWVKLSETQWNSMRLNSFPFPLSFPFPFICVALLAAFVWPAALISFCTVCWFGQVRGAQLCTKDSTCPSSPPLHPAVAYRAYILSFDYCHCCLSVFAVLYVSRPSLWSCLQSFHLFFSIFCFFFLAHCLQLQELQLIQSASELPVRSNSWPTRSCLVCALYVARFNKCATI